MVCSRGGGRISFSQRKDGINYAAELRSHLTPHVVRRGFAANAKVSMIDIGIERGFWCCRGPRELPINRCKTGDQMQWIAGTIYSILRWRAFPPRYLFCSALEMMRESAGFLQSISVGPDGAAAWRELQNKIEAFSHFEYADCELGLAGNPGLSLQELVFRAFQLKPYHSVWAMEGLGHCYASFQRLPGQFPDKLLCEEKTRALPAGSLIPLHAGMGLMLAELVLELLSQYPASCLGLIDKFEQLCRNNSREGYSGVAFEALGLVARNLYPQLIPRIDSYLSRDGDLLAYFWHGIGRGIYFHPGNFPPLCSAPWKAVDMCRHEPPHNLGRRNAIAGLAWALMLVNIRHPEVVGAFLKHHETDIAEDEAFANGMRSALFVWGEASANDPHLNALRVYVPQHCSPSLLKLWNRCVTESCHWACSCKGITAANKAVDSIFQYQHISSLFQSTREAEVGRKNKW